MTRHSHVIDGLRPQDNQYLDKKFCKELKNYYTKLLEHGVDYAYRSSYFYNTLYYVIHEYKKDVQRDLSIPPDTRVRIDKWLNGLCLADCADLSWLPYDSDYSFEVNRGKITWRDS